MPLAFVTARSPRTMVINPEEKRILKYITDMASVDQQPESPYAVAVDVQFRFVKSNVQGAAAVRATSDPSALPVYLTEEDIRRNWPLTYDELTARCRTRYSDFKVDKKYHQIRKQFASNATYAHLRLLDTNNPDGVKKQFYSPTLLQELDKHYTKK